MSSPAVLANNVLIKIGGTDLSADMNQADLSMSQGTIDTSTFGASGWMEFITSISQWAVAITGFFNKATAKTDAVLYAMFGAPGSATTFEIDVPNSSAGSVKYTGNVWAKDYKPGNKINDASRFSGSLQGTGALTRAVI
jgi:predicted secreted protein